MTARDLVEALGGRWHGSYGMARCPIHADRTPSLKVVDAADNSVNVHCFGGCSWKVVKEDAPAGRVSNSVVAKVRDIQSCALFR